MAAETKVFEKVVELEGERTTLKRQIDKLEQELWTAGQDFREAKAEAKHLSSFPEQVKVRRETVKEGGGEECSK
jgi:hypothetical protein